MEIGNIIKAIMSRKNITQLVFGEMTGKKANGLSRDLQSTPKPVADRVRMLELLGYEVIVRERRPGRRADGEYVVTVGDEGTEEEEKREAGAEKEKAPARGISEEEGLAELKRQKAMCE